MIMKIVILVFSLVALGAAQCPTKTSTWTVNNFLALWNNIEFRFERRLDMAGACKHYFRLKSRCTQFEGEYTTTQGVGLVSQYTITSMSQAPVNLGACPNINIATQQGRIFRSFYSTPNTGWYHLFLSPFAGLNQEYLAWGGYFARWSSGPKQVWFP